ncbi:MAG: NAD(+) diphosphatase [Uliginosibacterium sp.]|nr:NAD(+) diphosphatase [Uliginosibacterium sp.]
MWPHDFAPGFGRLDDTTDDAANFAFLGETLLLRDDNSLPSTAALQRLPTPLAAFKMGTLGMRSAHALAWPDTTPVPQGLKAVGLRDVFSLQAAEMWGVAARARQMLRWDLASRYCGTCGKPTQALEGEPAKECPACGMRDYPRIAPAVMALVRKGDTLLLARSPHFRHGMYSALAGFVEAGETVEACLHREVFEESGIRIKNLRWFASQPWPFPFSLMLAFHADYAGGEITPQPGEIEDARWFGLKALPDLPAPVSIASRLIHAGIAEIRKGNDDQAPDARFDPRNNAL